MALRSQKAVGGIAALMLASAAWAQAPVEFKVRHDHWRKGCDGVLRLTAEGVSFQGERKHTWTWKYDDIQELEVTERALRVTTYRDRLLRLGADAREEFLWQPGQSPQAAYEMLRLRLDQRFVAALPQTARVVTWSVPAKLLGVLRGSEGELVLAPDHLEYRTNAAEQSRIWRFTDIDNISRTGPFRFTVVTWERARAQYGDRREFNFHLKQPLADERYEALWLRLNQGKGLKILSSYREGEKSK